MAGESFVAKIAPEGSGESACEVEAKAGGVSTCLKGVEEFVRVRDSTAVVEEFYGDSLCVCVGGDSEGARRFGGLMAEGADAVGGEVEKDLHEFGAVGPDEWESRFEIPCAEDGAFPQGRSDDDAEVIQDRGEIDLGLSFWVLE